MGRYTRVVRHSYRVARVIVMFWVYVALLVVGSVGVLVASGVKQVLSGVGRLLGRDRSSTPSQS